MKKVVFGSFVFFFLLTCHTSHAQIFHGIRPHIANTPEHQLVLSFPIIPPAGLSDLFAIEKSVEFITAFNRIKVPKGNETLAVFAEQAMDFINNANVLYGKNISVVGAVLPFRLFGINTRWFELSIDGGIQDYTSIKVTGLKNKLSAGDIWIEHTRDHKYIGMKIAPQNILKIIAVSFAGADTWAIAKIPIKGKTSVITPLAGIGISTAYGNRYGFSMDVEEFVTSQVGFFTTKEMHQGFIWAISGMAGFQFDSTYVGFRTILQLCGKPNLPWDDQDRFNVSPIYNMGTDMRIWKIANIRAEIRDLSSPEYNVEIQRGFLYNSEVAVGGLFRSRLFGKSTGYVALSLGSKYIKFNLITLTNGKTLGALLGLLVGLNPE